MSAPKTKIQYDKDDFDTWRDHPMTRIVMAYFQERETRQKEIWDGQSWNGGRADQAELIKLRAKAAAYEEFRTLDFYELSGEDYPTKTSTQEGY